MASAAAELSTNLKVVITRNSTLLIDDDSCNIEAALSNSVRAILFHPDHSDRLLPDIVFLLEADETARSSSEEVAIDATRR